jgi:Uma2 family endonuclease
MSAAPRQRWTVEDYLAHERASEQRHEYLNGEITLMAGASESHNLIVTNILASLHTQLRQRPCRVYPGDMRVKISRASLYTYPDVSVVCEPPQYEDDQRDTLLNPALVIEVLSPSTESYDRGRKFQPYRSLPSLREYVLVAQDSQRVERYVRQSDGMWLLDDAEGADSVMNLQSIDCTLRLADVYEKVEFESE